MYTTLYNHIPHDPLQAPHPEGPLAEAPDSKVGKEELRAGLDSSKKLGSIMEQVQHDEVHQTIGQSGTSQEHCSPTIETPRWPSSNCMSDTKCPAWTRSKRSKTLGYSQRITPKQRITLRLKNTQNTQPKHSRTLKNTQTPSKIQDDGIISSTKLPSIALWAPPGFFMVKTRPDMGGLK